MGEMADLLLDQMFDEESFEPEDYVGPRRGPLIKTCKFCGMNGFVWGKVWDPHTKKNNWRLFKDGVGHVCKYKNK